MSTLKYRNTLQIIVGCIPDHNKASFEIKWIVTFLQVLVLPSICKNTHLWGSIKWGRPALTRENKGIEEGILTDRKGTEKAGKDGVPLDAEAGNNTSSAEKGMVKGWKHMGSFLIPYLAYLLLSSKPDYLVWGSIHKQ